VKDLFLTETGKQWKIIGLKERHGIALPLFSLHTERSCGIGEYLDLLPLIDWCVNVGMNVIQLLPLNDTGLETSPYSAISAFALNPLFLSLYIYKEAPTLPRTPRVDYPAVREAKHIFLKNLQPSLEGYEEFCQQTPWLEPYAEFKARLERNANALWSKWSNLSPPPPNEIAFHKKLQFLCHQQLTQVKAYAEQKGVLLMGDLPILVAHNSHDVREHPDYFDLEFGAGAPPDYYNAQGQAWGLPIYHWDPQERDDFSWWRARFSSLAPYFHLYRIDHIIGFFRLWAIPSGRPSGEGHYIPASFDKMFEQGMKLMHLMLRYSPLLPIGEDLGDIPDAVRRALIHLGICGTKVIRWEREGDRKDGPYIPIDHYPKESLTTVSTHDSEPLRLWWRDYPDESQAFCDYLEWKWEPTLSLDRLEAILTISHYSPSLFAINPLQEYLALAGLTRGSLEDQRINKPGTVSPNNWSHRFSPTVKEMQQNTRLTSFVKKMIPKCAIGPDTAQPDNPWAENNRA